MLRDRLPITVFLSAILFLVLWISWHSLNLTPGKHVMSKEQQQELQKLEDARAALQDEEKKAKAKYEAAEQKLKKAKEEYEAEEQKINEAQRKINEEKEQLAKEKQSFESEKKSFEKEKAKAPTIAAVSGLDSTPEKTKFPNITVLPEYRLEPFVSPDPRTGKERTLQDMSEAEVEERYYELIEKNHIRCAETRRMGNTGDGGWDICVSEPFRPKKGNCLVYSFGINYDFSFDDAMAKEYGCLVKAFDPSMKKVNDHHRSELVWFYKLGLGEENTNKAKGWKLQTLGTILANAKDDNKTIDVLKMDIELNEWSCFRTMLKEGVLDRVKQFVFEIHTFEINLTKRTTTLQELSTMAETLISLERIGFRKFHNHRNPFGRYTSTRTGKKRLCCSELYYINTSFMK